jgi:hypothetical protein
MRAMARRDQHSSLRWRVFADAVALALGINVWISVVVLPGFFVEAFHTTSDMAIAGVPLLLLLIGVWRSSDLFLLLLFPSSLMLPVAFEPAMVSGYVYGLTRFVVVAVGLVAYLFGASFFTSFYEPPEPANVRPLASSRRAMPARWKRRFRMYRALVLLSVVFPMTLLYTVNFDPTSARFLRQMFPGRIAQMTTVADLAAISLWLLLYLYAFLGVMRHHRTGDRVLAADLGRIEQSARKGTLGPAFFLGVICAICFMVILIMGRYL